MRLSFFWDRPKLIGKIKISGIRAIYLNNLLRGVANALVGVFYPAYVYLLGYQHGGFRQGIILLLLSIAIERGVIFFVSISVGKLVNKIGFKWAILISSLINSAWFLLPALFPVSYLLVMILSVLAGLLIPIYWFARLSILTIDGEKEAAGAEVSFLSLIDQASSILGPLAGGLLVVFGGFPVLFSLATFICLLSALPIFFIQNYEIKDGISVIHFISWFKGKKDSHLKIAFVGQGLANFVDGFFWPLFVFLMVGSFTVLGAMTTVTFAIASVAIFLAGKVFDGKRAMGGKEDEREFSVATLFLSFVTLVRPLLNGLGTIFCGDAIYRIIYPFWGVDYDAYLYSAGKRHRSPLEFFTYREMVYSLGQIFGPLILILFSEQRIFWWAVFVIGSIGTVMTWGMQKES